MHPKVFLLKCSTQSKTQKLLVVSGMDFHSVSKPHKQCKHNRKKDHGQSPKSHPIQLHSPFWNSAVHSFVHISFSAHIFFKKNKFIFCVTCSNNLFIFNTM